MTNHKSQHKEKTSGFAIVIGIITSIVIYVLLFTSCMLLANYLTTHKPPCDRSTDLFSLCDVNFIDVTIGIGVITGVALICYFTTLIIQWLFCDKTFID